MASHFCSLLLPSPGHPKSASMLEAPLNTPFIGAATLSKTPQEDKCSRLDTPELLQQQSAVGKVLKPSRKPSEEGEMVHFNSYILQK